MLPSIFLKHKICWNYTISLRIVNYSNIIRKNNEDFATKRGCVIQPQPSIYTMLQASKRLV